MKQSTGDAITFFSNIPNPYNDRLFAALRREGVAVRAIYKHEPQAEGRRWPVELHPDDLIAGSAVAEAKAWRAAAGTHVILTGSYATAVDATRRLMVSRRARSLHVWGERLQPNGRLVHSLRRGYFAPWRLDGILAIGSRARRTYQAVTGTDIALHTFPYTTDRGLDTPPAPAERPTIGFAGRLMSHKGLDVTCRALALIGAEHRPTLEIAGASAPTPSQATIGDLQDMLVRLTRDLGIEDSVVWLGELTPDQLDTRRSRWWAQVVPTQQNEGWGVVVNEALNSAVPVISSDQVNAAVDMVRTDLNGVVLDDDASARPDAWAAAMTTIIADSEKRRAMSGAAREVGRAFAPANAAPWLIELLTDAARARAGAGVKLMARSFVGASWTRWAETSTGQA